MVAERLMDMCWELFQSVDGYKFSLISVNGSEILFCCVIYQAQKIRGTLFFILE